MTKSNFKSVYGVLVALCLAVFALPAGAQFITATITVTNTPSDGDTVVLDGSTRTFKTTVTIPASQVTIGASANAAATNLFQQVSATPLPGTIWTFTSTNAMTLKGTNVTATKTGTWGTIVLTTNGTTSATAYLLPASAVPAATATNQANQAVVSIDTFATNRFSLASPALFNFLDLSTVQSATNKSFFSSLFSGGTNVNTALSNSPAISGILVAVTNGVWTNATLGNATNKGAAFSSVGAGTGSEQFGSGATATGVFDTVLGLGASASGGHGSVLGSGASSSGLNSMALGYQATVTGANSAAIGAFTINTHANTTVLGTSAFATADNQILLGGNNAAGAAQFIEMAVGVVFDAPTTNFTTAGTNTLGGKVAFPRFNNVSLANGNNSGINLGTNVYVVFSGPTGAFTNCGFLAGQNGEIHICENGTTQTMAIADDSGNDTTAANRFYTGLGTGGLVTMTNAHASFMMIYSTSDSHWRFVGRPSQ